MKKNFGDILSDFFDQTYGLGIIVVAILAIAIPVGLAMLGKLIVCSLAACG